MRIAILVKHIPIAIGDEADFTRSALSDEYALEVAGMIKDNYEDTSITAIALCPKNTLLEESRLALIKALSTVCDEAYLLYDQDFFDSDAYGRSLLFAHAIRYIQKEGTHFDLIIDGEQDYETTGIIGPMTAAHLGLPSISSVSGIRINHIHSSDEEAFILAETKTESERCIIKALLPSWLTIAQTEHQPRYPSFIRLRWANAQSIHILTASDILKDPTFAAGSNSLTTVVSAFQSIRRIKQICVNAEDNVDTAVKELVSYIKHISSILKI